MSCRAPSSADESRRALLPVTSPASVSAAELSKEEKKSAQKVLDEVNKKFNGKVVTTIRKEKNYCKAEEYHQKYFEKQKKR